MPGSNNNKASRNKQMNNGKTSTATSGNKRHIANKNSGKKSAATGGGTLCEHVCYN